MTIVKVINIKIQLHHIDNLSIKVTQFCYQLSLQHQQKKIESKMVNVGQNLLLKEISHKIIKRITIMKEIRILTKIIIIETEIINEIEAKKRIINNMMKSIMKSYFLLKILKKNIMIK